MNKKILNILLLATVGTMTLTTSCSDDDFLEEKPKSILTINNAFQSSDQIVATLMSGYSTYAANFIFDGAWGSNERSFKITGTDMYDQNEQLVHMSNFGSNWSSTSDWVKIFWDDYYKIIAFANLALSQMDNVTWTDEADKARCIAEAHFLRGMFYLRLAEYYGGVPIIQEYSDKPRYDYTRASRAETYQFAIDELTAGYNGLPEKVTGADKGRASKYAAAQFLSEAYLALGVETNNNNAYGEAERFAREVIAAHPLMTHRFGVRVPSATGSTNDIPNAFKEGNVISDLYVSQNVVSDENTEAVWVMYSAPDYATYNANSGAGLRNNGMGFTPAVQDFKWDEKYMEAGAGDGPWNTVSAKYGSMTNPALHGGYGWGLFPTTWYATYDMWTTDNENSPVDLRYVENVTVRTKYLCLDENHSLYEKPIGWEYVNKKDINSASKFYPVFYKHTPLDAWDYDLNDPGMYGNKYIQYYRNQYVCRSAEAYLLLAEACLRAGKTGEALEAVNTVRRRAQATPFTTISIDKILSERGRELILEEDRWATFLRMKPEEWKPRILNYGMWCARPGAKVYPEQRRWADYTGDIFFNLWPIPQTYIDLNKEAEMPQNDGWK